METKEQLMAMYLQEYVKRVKRDMKGLVSVALISVENGSVLFYDSADPLVDNRESGGYQVGIIRSAARALKNSHTLGNKEMNDITIAYDGQKHILVLSEKKNFLSHVIINKEGNLALAKRIIDKHSKDTTRELGERLGNRNFSKEFDITQ